MRFLNLKDRLAIAACGLGIAFTLFALLTGGSELSRGIAMAIVNYR
jgi:hypothetical protein